MGTFRRKNVLEFAVEPPDFHDENTFPTAKKLQKLAQETKIKADADGKEALSKVCRIICSGMVSFGGYAQYLQVIDKERLFDCLRLIGVKDEETEALYEQMFHEIRSEYERQGKNFMTFDEIFRAEVPGPHLPVGRTRKEIIVKKAVTRALRREKALSEEQV